MKLAYYVSSHGFGHLTRTLPLMDYLAGLNNSKHKFTVYLCSAHPRFLIPNYFEDDNDNPNSTTTECRLIFRQLNAENGGTFDGVYQSDGLTVDLQQTLSELCSKESIERQSRWVVSETEWLQQNGIRLVVCDAPFLACQAATQAGILTVVHSNFFWDSIYSSLKDELLPEKTMDATCEIETTRFQLDTLIERVRTAYSGCSGWLRMPGWIETHAQTLRDSNVADLTSERHRWIIDVPAIMRHPACKWSRERTLCELHRISEGQWSSEITVERLIAAKLLLVTFGGHAPLDWSLISESSQLDPICVPNCSGDWLILIISIDSAADKKYFSRSNRVLPVDGRLLSHQSTDCDGISLPDLIKSSAVVLSKLGFGTCGECIAGQSRMLYVSRRGFAAEERGLAQWMQREAVALEMPLTDFSAGRWQPWIEKICRIKWPVTNSRDDNSQTSVDIVADILLNKIIQL